VLPVDVKQPQLPFAFSPLSEILSVCRQSAMAQPFMIASHRQSSTKQQQPRHTALLFDDEELVSRAGSAAALQNPKLHAREGLLARAMNRPAAEIVTSALRGYYAANNECHARVAAVVRAMLETAVARAAAEQSPLGWNVLSDGMYVQAYTGLYNCYVEEQRWPEAEASVRKALSYLGNVVMSSSRKQAGISVGRCRYDSGLRADLETALACTILQRTHGLPKDRAAEAQPLLESALKVVTLDFSPGTWYLAVNLLAECCAENGDLIKAMNIYHTLLRFAPSEPNHPRKKDVVRTGRDKDTWLTMPRCGPGRKDLKKKIALLALHQQLLPEPSSTAKAAPIVNHNAKGAFAQRPGLNQIRNVNDEYVPLWMNAKALDSRLVLASPVGKDSASDVKKSITSLEDVLRCNPRLWQDDPVLASEICTTLVRARRTLARLESPP
jgi:tetratricopeptide (TPR) repeat protein